MLQYLHMGRQELVRRIQWKDLSIMQETLKEESCLEAWRKYLDLSRCSQIRTQLSWLEHLTYRYIMK
jgi:hypothetical protein